MQAVTISRCLVNDGAGIEAQPGCRLRGEPIKLTDSATAALANCLKPSADPASLDLLMAKVARVQEFALQDVDRFELSKARLNRSGPSSRHRVGSP